MTRKSDETRSANERALERRMIRQALSAPPKRAAPSLTGGQIFWQSEITPADIRAGRRYEAAMIADAEHESARRRA